MRGSIFIAFFISACLLTLMYAGFAIATYKKPLDAPRTEVIDSNRITPEYLEYVKQSRDTTIIFTEEDSILSVY